MVIAIGADIEGRHEVAMKDHLTAGPALAPKIVWRIAFLEYVLDLWSDDIVNPVHGRLLWTRLGGQAWSISQRWRFAGAANAIGQRFHKF